MGWKSVREHYGIEGANRIVQVVDGQIYIGVQYIQDLMKISVDGVLVKKDDVLGSADFARYAKKMEEDPEKLKELVKAKDVFSKSIVVYTYDGGQILEKECEEPGWPNVTHDGLLMYENTFSTEKAKVIKWARENASAGVNLCRRQVMDAEDALERARTQLIEQEEALRVLERDYPKDAGD